MTVQYSVKTKILNNEKLCVSARNANKSWYQTLADQNLPVSKEMGAVLGLYVWKFFQHKVYMSPCAFCAPKIPFPFHLELLPHKLLQSSECI